jgi:hypothetical protein
MSGETLKSKTVEITMILDGQEFRHSVIIPDGSAKVQWIKCQGIGDIVAKTILHNTDLKEQFKQQVSDGN